MTSDNCILTTKDLTILEVMLERRFDPDDELAPLLRRKIAAARIVLRDDAPANLATLNSRVSFSVDEGDTEVRIISHDPMHAARGLFLPVSSRRGLALLGLSEGDAIGLPRADGEVETIRLIKVLYQPEASRRERAAAVNPALRVIQGG